jgi:predicted DNA-binding transcriptional regulator AlpA
MAKTEVKLIGLKEIAELAGVSRQQVWNWTDSKGMGFPEPVARLGMGPVFSAAEVSAWLKARKS